MIPKRFECMGMTVTVTVGGLSNSDEHGTYDHDKRIIAIDKDDDRQTMESAFWHEFVHCALDHLGYSKLSKDEKFTERMGQLLYQLQRTKRGEQ